ncbi:MAG: sialate O-acetylesterase [Prevotella sp.]|jgi:hypothetical protein
MFNRLCLLLLSLFAFLFSAEAKVKLPHVISNGMILQQQSEARLWGWSKPGYTVEVTTSWLAESCTTKVGKDGKWSLKVKTPKAGYTPLSITFTDNDKARVVVSDVLSGEVWVCGGQSNMEMPIRGFWACPVESSNEVIAEANRHKGIRYVKIPSVMSMSPLEDASCEWKNADTHNVADCSAAGYFFARTINGTLDVPVGLILANKGGTRVESWLDEDNLKRNTQEPLDSAGIVKKYEADYHRPLVWGNGTFSPIVNYSVKGILFYQGCSNVGDPAGQYTSRLKLLVEQWRRDFRQGDIPFYFVQIAPFSSGDKDGDWNTRLRQQQLEASRVIPNSGIVCTQDLVYPYEVDQIHPSQKRQVGERLAYLALNQQYGYSDLPCLSPSYKSMRVEGSTCYIKLNDTYHSMNRMQGIEGFELAGEDKVFHPATATWNFDQGVILKCAEVQKPVAVRYCWRNFQMGNFANAAGLPLFPFRTDQW